MTVFAAVVLTIGVILYILYVRREDLPAPAPVSPTEHLEDKKAAIYENLRDLQFEYRVGKLSDHDYQQTKLDLQRELAGVLAEIDRVNGPARASAVAPAAPAPPEPQGAKDCPHCGAQFPQPLKFCGECGKPLTGVTA